MIRPAEKVDANKIAPLIMLAMGPLAYTFANTDNVARVTDLFTRFVANDNNQYSFENILVDDLDGTITGMIIGYDGARLDELRRPFLEYIRGDLGFAGTVEDETGPGEFYIDCLAVHPQYQGTGIAKRLITGVLERAAALGHHTVGLLVHQENEPANRLYSGLGFEEVGRQTLLGDPHYHLQRKV